MGNSWAADRSVRFTVGREVQSFRLSQSMRYDPLPLPRAASQCHFLVRPRAGGQGGRAGQGLGGSHPAHDAGAGHQGGAGARGGAHPLAAWRRGVGRERHPQLVPRCGRRAEHSLWRVDWLVRVAHYHGRRPGLGFSDHRGRGRFGQRGREGEGRAAQAARCARGFGRRTQSNGGQCEGHLCDRVGHRR